MHANIYIYKYNCTNKSQLMSGCFSILFYYTFYICVQIEVWVSIFEFATELRNINIDLLARFTWLIRLINCFRLILARTKLRPDRRTPVSAKTSCYPTAYLYNKLFPPSFIAAVVFVQHCLQVREMVWQNNK